MSKPKQPPQVCVSMPTYDLMQVATCLSLIKLMDKKGVDCCVPLDDKTAYGDDDLIDFTSGYVQRALDRLPQQGKKSPWRNYQNYLCT